MGNCQAAEAAAVLIQHPGGGRTERAYWALSAGAVMAANPGHYVAAVIATTPQPAAAGDASGSGSATVKHLKLLRPDDTLLLGRVYRLVSFEEVLRDFASKRHVKLSRVTIRTKDEEAKPAAKHRRRRASVDSRSAGAGAGAGKRKESDRSLAKVMRRHTEEVEPEPEPEPAGPSSSGPGATKHGNTDAAAADLDAELDALLPHGALLVGRRAARQWRPALQSIAEG